jgi:hypothetical protein
MVLPIKFMADWGAIEQQRQKEMGRHNRRENASRISHDYKVGNKVLLKKPGKLLIYSHSRNPRCAPARTHGQIQAPGEPPN